MYRYCTVRTGVQALRLAICSRHCYRLSSAHCGKWQRRGHFHTPQGWNILYVRLLTSLTMQSTVEFMNGNTKSTTTFCCENPARRFPCQSRFWPLQLCQKARLQYSTKEMRNRFSVRKVWERLKEDSAATKWATYLTSELRRPELVCFL